MEEKLKQKSADLIKVVLFGPESTGKTTLAETLANQYNTKWVPEYMREYLQEKWDKEKKICEPKDLLPIAEGQMLWENNLSDKANKILFCDTNLLELKVYSEAYYNGYCPEPIEKYALKNEYNLYFLTYIDVPWEEDDLRDKPNDRENMFLRFKNTLETNNIQYVLLKGDFKTRLQTASNHIEKLINKYDDTHRSR
ncbi:AAA family ATPase [Galbibacter mesophilus]|uniref:AAA family ATPase n=1 Tax=Galbibacter mesophilus TaxID=379069 RepID=UPI00191E9898|nr:ATP-binding protein [Galbibacter mesophilus]MCM5661835.1 ATP-binding protein [Galbibacter mesophilus]